MDNAGPLPTTSVKAHNRNRKKIHRMNGGEKEKKKKRFPVWFGNCTIVRALAPPLNPATLQPQDLPWPAPESARQRGYAAPPHWGSPRQLRQRPIGTHIKIFTRKPVSQSCYSQPPPPRGRDDPSPPYASCPRPRASREVPVRDSRAHPYSTALRAVRTLLSKSGK